MKANDPLFTKQEYLYWLRKKAGLAEPINETVSQILFGMPFFHHLKDDENRAEDGVELRKMFVDENQLSLELENPECNMLEFIIALAGRLDYLTYNHMMGDQTSKWVNIFLDNLGIMYSRDVREIENNVACLTAGAYDNYGHGGIFVFENKVPGLSDKDYWTQMNLFVSENFDKLY